MINFFQEPRKFLVLFLIISIFFNFYFFSPNIFFNRTYIAKADNFVTSVVVHICGNSIIEGDEFCDDGTNNGRYAFNANDKFCNTSCTGWAPYCGDGTIQSVYDEACDDGNNVAGDGCSPICLIETPGGGGGGGGGAYQPAPVTAVRLSGKAYPLSKVSVLKDGQLAITTIAGPDANFNVSIEGLSAGNYMFSLYSEDEAGRRSSLFTFPIYITPGAITTISGIFISPTIDTDKSEVKKGEVVKIFGQSIPNSDITVIISSEEELYGKTKSDKIGAYLYNLDTVEVEMGDHLAKSRAATLEEEISPLSKVVSFKVGTKTVLKPTSKCGKADLNCDNKVNLIDFSVAAYWYKRSLSTAFKSLEAERLNGDGKIDLVDFSIMAYYWTG